MKQQMQSVEPVSPSTVCCYNSCKNTSGIAWRQENHMFKHSISRARARTQTQTHTHTQSFFVLENDDIDLRQLQRVMRWSPNKCSTCSMGATCRGERSGANLKHSEEETPATAAAGVVGLLGDAATDCGCFCCGWELPKNALTMESISVGGGTRRHTASVCTIAHHATRTSRASTRITSSDV